MNKAYLEYLKSAVEKAELYGVETFHFSVSEVRSLYQDAEHTEQELQQLREENTQLKARLAQKEKPPHSMGCECWECSFRKLPPPEGVIIWPQS